MMYVDLSKQTGKVLNLASTAPFHTLSNSLDTIVLSLTAVS
jgi:hypothetical protein